MEATLKNAMETVNQEL